MNLLVIGAGVGLVLLAFVAYWSYRERSARGVGRRARSSGRSVTAGVGMGLVGVVSVFVGMGEGLSVALGAFGDLALQHSGILAQVGIAGLGWGALAGKWHLTAMAFAIAAGAMIAVHLLFGGGR